MGTPYTASSDYNGNESAVSARAIRRPGGDDYFQVSKIPIPMGAVPIVDDDTDTVIGYRRVVQGNTWTCDIDGHLVSIEEPGLGTPLVDPLDLIFIIGAVGRIALRSAVKAGLDIAGDVAGKATARVIASTGTAALRYAFRRLVQRELQFTAKTAARMAQPGRYVPVDILKLAVRYGVRDADPQGVPGAFRYTIPMLKAAKRLGDPPRRYILRVIVRERDWTILHFHYDR
jgi:hypothetical protein